MISFIIIGRNEGWRLKKCLDSVFRVIATDSITHHEVIYVDSKSSDESIITAKNYSSVKVLLITGECNAAVARNIGAKEARGDILFFIDGDMEIHTGFISQILTEKEELYYPFISGVFVDRVYDENWQFLYEKPRMQYTSDGAYETVVGGLFLITSKLWNDAEGMDTRQKRSQDYDLGLRLARRGVLLYRRAEVLAHHHMVVYSTRANYVADVKYTALLFRKHWHNRYYIPTFIRQHYTTVVMWLMILTCLTGIWWGVLIYPPVLIYKALKQSRNSNNATSVLRMCRYIIQRDAWFGWYLLTAREAIINLSYKNV